MNQKIINVSSEVREEINRAMIKHPAWPTDPFHALAVISEELGELTKEVLDVTYSPDKGSRDNLREEAIQTAAMCIRFVINLDDDRYNFVPRD